MDKIIEQIERVNMKLDDIIDIIRKPKNKIFTALEIAAAAVSALGFLSIIEIIRNWVFGG